MGPSSQLTNCPRLHPNVSISYCRPGNTYAAKDVHLVPGARDATGTKGFYKPIVFPNDFWLLRSHLTEINTTTPNISLQVTFQPMSYLKFQVFASMTRGFDEAIKQQGGGTGAELDEVKRMLLETNPWFLALTGLVSILHTV